MDKEARTIVDFEDCIYCNSTGWIEAGQWPCDKCGGSGMREIYADEEGCLCADME